MPWKETCAMALATLNPRCCRLFRRGKAVRYPTFPHAWRYRDSVISALNHDVPFDRFISGIATGFLAIGSKSAKAMNDNFAMDVVDDQIDVVGRGVLGLSVACYRR